MNNRCRIQISGKNVQTVEILQRVLKRFQKKEVTLSETVEFILKTLKTNYKPQACGKIDQKLIAAASKTSGEKKTSGKRTVRTKPRNKLKPEK
jgi:hypothetical protein